MAISQVGNITHINQNAQLNAQFQANNQNQINLQSAINIEEFTQKVDENKEIRKAEGIESVDKDSSNSSSLSYEAKEGERDDKETHNYQRENIYSNDKLLDIEV